MSWAALFAAGPAAHSLCAAASAQTPAAVDPAPADKRHLTLSPELAAACKSDGGCALVTKQALDDMLLKAAREGYTHGRREAEATCRRGTI